MRHRSLASVAVAALWAVFAVTAAPAAGQAPAPAAKNDGKTTKAYVQPKTADGQPDLSGYWTNFSVTPFERLKNVTKEFYTPQEAAQLEKDANERDAAFRAKPGSIDDVHYDETQFGLSRSQAQFARSLRTSVIFDPPDGRIPPQTAEAQKRNAAITAARKQRGAYDAVQNMQYDDRCIIMDGLQPPMVIAASQASYLTNYQIIQSPGYVTILSERLHDVRTIPLDGRPFPSSNVRSWTGISRGHWQGNTLVVETRNTNGKFQAAAPPAGTISRQLIVGATEDLRVIERFTRTDADSIKYQFTIEDPKTWVSAWSGEVSFVKMDIQGPFFEMACHEGNGAPTNMLGGARRQEKLAAEAAAKKKGSN